MRTGVRDLRRLRVAGGTFQRWRAVWAAALLLLATGVTAEIVDLQILQTTDVHGHFTRGDAPDSGGWLRLATLVRRQRAGPDAGRTILVDCGDSCQGTLPAMLSRGEAAIALLKHLHYDVWIPGNHEFDFGVARYTELCGMLADIALGGNVECLVAGAPQRLPAWRLLERGSARVAVLGANARYLEQWLWGDAMAGYRVESAVAMLERVLPEVLRTRPDMIILAIHQGWLIRDDRTVNEVALIARRFPEIDLILGAHTHRPVAGTRIGRRTWYVQAGRHGDNLAVVRAQVDVAEHRVVNITSRLVPAAAGVPPDAAAQRCVAPWLEAAAAYAGRPVGELARAVPAAGRPGETCAVSELLCQAIAAVTEARVVLHGRLSRADLAAGPVKEGHLFAVVPYENTLATARLTADELRTVLAEQDANRSAYTYCGLWGLAATVFLDQAGTVSEVRVPEDAFAGDGRIKVALNSYTAAGAGGRFPLLREILRRPACAARDTGINSRAALRQFLAEHSPVTVKARRWLTRVRAD